MSFKYISLFSGIGGFEHPEHSPVLFCEKDANCRSVLSSRYPSVDIASDVTLLRNIPNADYVVGGWPCQDISIAGNRKGIQGERSGLFFEMLRVAKEAQASTLIGENVPNLLTINRGADFELLLSTLHKDGYPYIGWRMLNSRAFGLPQERRRLFIVASTDPKAAEAIHAEIPFIRPDHSKRNVYGFYWTAGKRSICFSPGYVPTLKIGATDENGRAPVAIFYENIIRKLTPTEFLALQGFSLTENVSLSSGSLLRMAGNAVPVPLGNFVLKAIGNRSTATGIRSSFGIVTESGLYEDGIIWAVDHKPVSLASNLDHFISFESEESLSPQAAAGLIVRSVKADNLMPLELFETLYRMSANRSQKLRPSRSNSFMVLDEMIDDVMRYRNKLPSMDIYQRDFPTQDNELEYA